jgi:ABC-type transport system involved in cytochrome c biogenesis permease subunit|tara:strand:+ start:281387 stop:284278 length:2892 start_codon:yes stop_codon:yes gene_type:complete
MHIKFKSVYQFLISARMVFFLMPPLMVLLIAGTVAQKELGLYTASKYFFAGPAAWGLLGVLTCSLTLKFLCDSVWSWQKLGIILSHLGVLVLLYGGALTAVTNQEGYLIVAEAGRSATVLDYHQRSLVVLDDGQIIAEWTHDELKQGALLPIGRAGTHIEINDFCLNCNITRREGDAENAFGMAAKVKLSNKPAEKNDEENISGVTFTVSDMQYILFEGFTKPIGIEGLEVIYGRAQRRLPFSVELVDFTKNLYAGTQMAKAYSSDIIVHDGDVSWPSRIEMNQPLRYKGYTLFQSNYIEAADGRDSTILAVVDNKGWIFPYIGTAIMAFGLLYHMFLHLSARVRRNLSFVFVGAAIAILGASPSYAKPLDFKGFQELPVSHEGRVKPLDSFARIYLKRFSGHEKIDGQPAIVWLSELLFDPARAAQRPVFKVTHPDLRQKIGAAENAGRLFSLEDLMDVLAETAPQVNTLVLQGESDFSSGQTALLNLHENVLSYLQIMRSFSLVMPLEVALPEDIAQSFTADDTVNFLSLMPYEQRILERSKAVVETKKGDWGGYSETEGRYVSLGFAQDLIRKQNQGNVLFRIMPFINNDALEWVSPWAMIAAGGGSPVNKINLENWSGLISAYQMQDEAVWSNHVSALTALYHESFNTQQLRLQAEKLYNAWPLGALLLWGYGVALALLAFYVLRVGQTRSHIFFYLGMSAAALSALTHSALVGLRVYILDRPPVGTLYESILFVALVACFLALLIDMKQRRGFALLSGLFTALALLLVAPYFVKEGEGLDVLVAVLNTSFWLTTHVLCITIGYGVCILAACCAHIYLFRQAFGAKQQGDKLLTTLHRLTIAALFFTAFGTVLGGIWADQSWGRFWGWDPKENGALLIVFWLIWALHGRYSAMLSPRFYAAAIAYLNVIVTLSWFGVNLLNVGLHSYGFISGIAYGIVGVTLFETALIAGLLMRRAKLK